MKKARPGWDELRRETCVHSFISNDLYVGLEDFSI